MKVRVLMKTPDAMEEAIRLSVEGNPDPEERACLIEEASEVLGYWFRYGEYLTVEFDTELKTAVVLPA